MEHIIKELQNFNFTKIEAQVYLCLLKNEKLNGSQIAKIINIPRTSVYSALDSLYQKGVILMLPGEPTIYQVQNPKMFIKNIKNDYEKSISILEDSLMSFKNFGVEDQYWNIKGYDNFIANTKEILTEAEREVYISTNYDLQIFAEELRILEQRNVRIIVFSFEELNTNNLSVELYHHGGKKVCCDGSRMMLVVDQRKVLFANGNTYGEVFGTITQNSLLVSIVSEHIHHDIYLLKLKQKYGQDIVTKEIQLNSDFEKRPKVCETQD